MTDLIKVLGDKNVIDSRDISEMIGMRHTEILRKIEGAKDRVGYLEVLGENQMASADFFIKSEYIDEQGKSRTCYEFTKQGCEMFGNKLTGKKGVLFSAKYVEAFNKMETALKNNQGTIQNVDQSILIQQQQDFLEKVNGKLEVLEEHYKMTHADKLDIGKYIKQRLGITKANNEYEAVKTRILIRLGVTRWCDIQFQTFQNNMGIVDECIDAILRNRPKQLMIEVD